MSAIFYFADVPDLDTEDAYRLNDPAEAAARRSIWLHPHFTGAVAAQFFYVAAQAGIFSFFINYIIEEMPSISQGLSGTWFFQNRTVLRDAGYYVNEQGRPFSSVPSGSALPPGPRHGSRDPEKIESASGARDVCGCQCPSLRHCCTETRLDFGGAMFLSFFFMSIMFPTIFALGIYGLGVQAKRASGFIVMAIIGGAIMRKVMGHLGDVYNMSVSFLMPLGCFALIAVYGYFVPRLSKATRKIRYGGESSLNRMTVIYNPVKRSVPGFFMYITGCPPIQSGVRTICIVEFCACVTAFDAAAW